MRRGAVLNETKRQPVVADLHDLEGGGAQPLSGRTYMRSSSGESYSGASNGSFDITPMVASNGKDKKKRVKYGTSFANLTKYPPQKLQMGAIILFVSTCCICPFFPIEWSILTLVYAACAFGAIASLWLSQSVLNCDDGTPEMRGVSDPIREGAEGFLHVQYNAIARFAVPLAGLIVLSYQFRPSSDEAFGVAVLGNQILGFVAAVGFVAGASASAVSGYTAMWVAARANIRTASAARRTYGESLVVCFRGGAFSAVLNLTLCILGTLHEIPIRLLPFLFDFWD